jgi:transposase
MPRLAEVAPHLTVDELFEHYRGCRDVVAKTHWQILWWRAQRLGTTQIARLTGFRPDWIRRVVRRYNVGGPDAVGDQRAGNGAERMLDKPQQEELLSLLQGPAPDGGLWNSAKVALWMSERLGRPVFPQRGWDYLRHLGMSSQRPRPRHVEADVEAQAAFKKKSTKCSMPKNALTPMPMSSSGARTKHGSD